MTKFVKKEVFTRASRKEAKYFHAFNIIPGVGPITFKQLLIHFPSLEIAWSAPLVELVQAGLGKYPLAQIEKERPKISPDLEIEKLARLKINYLILSDEKYPSLLKETYAPPAILYFRGKLPDKDEPTLAVVGTRKLSLYGRQIAPAIVSQLSLAGLTIVSGLAKGIDTLAHRAALESGGKTIAVLGSGLDNKSIYPPINRTLAELISQEGALISEFPPGTKPLAQNFPQRNRIISGLSLGVLVIEAPEKSGALITARDAIEQNREVFAIPGHIFSQNSLGPHNLIKMGAKLVSQAADVLEELSLALPPQKTKKAQPTNQTEALILEGLSHQPTHIDKIIKQTKLSTATVNSSLILMEIKGQVKNLGNSNYILN